MRKKLTIILSVFLLSCGSNSPTQQKAVDNYVNHIGEFNQLIVHFKKLIPENKKVSIIFENEKKLRHLVIHNYEKTESGWSVVPKSIYHEDINSTNSREMIEELGWTEETIKELYSKLKDINCIGIDNTSNVANLHYLEDSAPLKGGFVYEFHKIDSMKLEYRNPL